MTEEKHSPLPWAVSAVDNDGSYGSGPDPSSGFTSYVIVDNDGRSIADTLNSGVALVCEETDEDGHSAWDEQGRVNVGLIIRAVNAHSALVASLRDHADVVHNETHSKTCGALRGGMCSTPSRCLRINEALRLAEVRR